MQNRTLEIGVGLFLLAGILALLLLALRVSGLAPTASTDTYKLYAYFDNIAGLTVRAKVTMAGVTIGKVTAIDLDRDSFTGRVTLQLENAWIICRPTPLHLSSRLGCWARNTSVSAWAGKIPCSRTAGPSTIRSRRWCLRT